ncbi:MAG TPA: ATP-binding cassette domain-containing protein [Gaiellaceae bacterium]|nr:ATP-binding cassette domain-containing protein [Gaiellaceae bacterium]
MATLSTAASAAAPALLEALGIQKHFGRVIALRAANFELAHKEVHAIVGDNGAGKTTLIKIISGVYRADGGELRLEGDRVEIANPRDARRLGIETTYQDLALADDLDAAANLYLGREEYLPAPLSWFGFLDKKAMRKGAEDAMRRLKIGIQSVEVPVLSLSGGQRQAVAVARAIAWGTRIVIMDEPTAALGVRESGMVLELIREVRKQGLAVIMISHNLPEVFAVADRITILRLGQTITTLNRDETTLEAVVGMMTGAVSVAA